MDPFAAADSGDKPANPVDNNPEVIALRARLAAIAKEVKTLDTLRGEFADRVGPLLIANSAAEKVVTTAQTELDAAKKAVTDFEIGKPQPSEMTADQKKQWDALKLAVVKAQGKLDGATAGLEAQQQLLTNIKQRIAVIDAKKEEYKQEVILINARIGEITNALSAGNEIPVGKAIPGTTPLNPDNDFLNYSNPLKAPAPK